MSVPVDFAFANWETGDGRVDGTVEAYGATKIKMRALHTRTSVLGAEDAPALVCDEFTMAALARRHPMVPGDYGRTLATRPYEAELAANHKSQRSLDGGGGALYINGRRFGLMTVGQPVPNRRKRPRRGNLWARGSLGRGSQARSISCFERGYQ